MALADSAAAAIVRRAPALCRAVAYVAAVLVAAPFVYHLARGSQAYLGLLEDDFFYYAIIADKLVTLGKLTYDGATITNGFHPLWFLVLLGLRLLAGGLNGAFYGMLTVVFAASMIATYELSRAFVRALGASPALAPAVALVHCVATYSVLASGMETALDVPLLLWLLLEVARDEAVTPRRAAKLGAIASLAILARLDIALVIALLVPAWLLLSRPKLREALRAALAFCATGLAVPAYALANLLAFGSVLPMSALAKQLVKTPGVNVLYLRIIASYTQYGRTAGITLALGAVAAFVAFRRRGTDRAVARPHALFTGALALVFAAVFFGINALNGWIYFGWYAYPLVAALLAAITFVGLLAVQRVPPAMRARASAALVVGAAALASFEAVTWFSTRGPLWSVEDNGLLAMSVDLASRTRDRQGVFAMGAIGGFATYVAQKPYVQIEGLVADRAMIEHIRHEDDLGAVLRDYGVDYLVVSLHKVPMEKHDGCYVVTQPNVEWAGKRVAKMRGEICTEPIVFFETRLPQHRWSSFSSLDTYVFDLHGARWRSAPGG